MTEVWEQYARFNDRLRFLLIHPGGLFGRFANVPLGIATLAAIMERLGFRVWCKDYQVEDFVEESLFDLIESEQINVVGFTSMTRQAPICYKMAAIIRGRFPRIKLIIGGHHPTVMPEEPLDNCFDVVYRGDGEESLLRTLPSLAQDTIDFQALRSIKGLAFKLDNEVVLTDVSDPFTELDSLPFPARHLFSFPAKYQTQFRIGKGHSAHMITSRGCIGRCFFCSNIPRPHATRSPEKIVDEMELLMTEYGVYNVFIQDDFSTPTPEHMIAVCDEIIRRGLKLNWAMSNTRAEATSPELLRKMKASGCAGVAFGIESGSPDIHRRIGKRNTLGDVEKAVRWAKAAGLLVGGFYIFGFPFETIENMKETLAFAKKLNTPAVTFAILCPFPGSPSFRYLEKKGQLLTRDWSQYSTHNKKLLFVTDKFTNEKLQSFRRYAYLSYHLSPRYILSVVPLML